MSSRQPQAIWVEQCDAARDIRVRYGLSAALDYVITEKLMNFASAAADHPEFARELPRFVSMVRSMFTPDELQTHIARVEREQREGAAAASEDDDELFPESPAALAEPGEAVRNHQGTIDRAGARDLVTGIEKGMSNKRHGTRRCRRNQNGATSVDDFNPAWSRFAANFGASSRLWRLDRLRGVLRARRGEATRRALTSAAGSTRCGPRSRPPSSGRQERQGASRGSRPCREDCAAAWGSAA